MTDFATARRRMVDNQLRTSNVTDRRLLAAMDEVPRELFVPEQRRELAYADVTHPLPAGRALAAPAPFAKLVQLAEIKHTDRILDVAAGTGYSSAVLAKLGAEVVALESDPTLTAAAHPALDAAGASQVAVATGPVDGSMLPAGKFDVIIVEGALDHEPATFFPALADGGRLVALVRTGGTPTAHVYVRSGSEVAGRIEFNTSLPPLTATPRPEAFVF